MEERQAGRRPPCRGRAAATLATWLPVRANRPCVQRTAFGNPVEPDVKIRRKRSSSSAGGPRSRSASTAARVRVVRVSVSSTWSRSTRLGASTRRSAYTSDVTSTWQSQWSIKRRELGAPVRGVDADDDRAADRGRAEPEQVLRRVVEEDADVRRRSGIAERLPQRGAPARLGGELAVGERAVLESRRDVVAVSVPEEEFGRAGHGGAFCGPRDESSTPLSTVVRLG